MEAPVSPLDPNRLAEDLRQTWQGRAVRETCNMPFGMAVLSMVAHSYDEAMFTLLRALFVGFQSIEPPFLITPAKVAKNGNVVADLVTRTGEIRKWVKLFENETEMQDAFRRLADRLKLADADRIDMFNAVKRWVVCDYRLDPTMDAFDPDAKRLVH